MIPKRSQNDPKMIPKRSKQMITKWSKWHQNGPKIIPKWPEILRPQVDGQTGPKWTDKIVSATRAPPRPRGQRPEARGQRPSSMQYKMSKKSGAKMPRTIGRKFDWKNDFQTPQKWVKMEVWGSIFAPFWGPKLLKNGPERRSKIERRKKRRKGSQKGSRQTLSLTLFGPRVPGGG